MFIRLLKAISKVLKLFLNDISMTNYQGFAIVCDGANVFPRYYTPNEAETFQGAISSGWDLREDKKPLRIVGKFLWLVRSAGYFLF